MQLLFAISVSHFCFSPQSLLGHFSALVALEPDSSDPLGAGANFRTTDDSEVVYLPLVTSEQQLLPIHFLSQRELGREDEIMRNYLDCTVTDSGIFVAKQKIPKKPLLVAQMMEEWFDFYRNSCGLATAGVVTTQDYSSDADSENDGDI